MHAAHHHTVHTSTTRMRTCALQVPPLGSACPVVVVIATPLYQRLAWGKARHDALAHAPMGARPACCVTRTGPRHRPRPPHCIRSATHGLLSSHLHVPAHARSTPRRQRAHRTPYHAHVRTLQVASLMGSEGDATPFTKVRACVCVRACACV